MNSAKHPSEYGNGVTLYPPISGVEVPTILRELNHIAKHRVARAREGWDQEKSSFFFDTNWPEDLVWEDEWQEPHFCQGCNMIHYPETGRKKE